MQGQGKEAVVWKYNRLARDRKSAISKPFGDRGSSDGVLAGGGGWQAFKLWSET